ncbi:MAG: 30S ribosome-binding factor RbfA [Gammaproteobacteria bacterium]
MSREFSRTRRVGEQIRRELSELIRLELKDPRVGMVTISAVEVSRDLGHAKVYVTVMNDDRQLDTLEALKHAAGFLRRELGHRMKIRTVPQLHFHYDESIEEGVRLSSLIDAAIASDRQKSGGHDE